VTFCLSLALTFLINNKQHSAISLALTSASLPSAAH
jgi:hypothetical protein